MTCALGCALGPDSVRESRLQYNEAVQTTTEQEMLLNVVRLRYTDTPSSLSVASIADQQEIISGLKVIPFFAPAGAGPITDYSTRMLPQVEVSHAKRPTLSYTPLDDREFTRRLFTPLSLESASHLARTTWPIATVFRLWLENLNWISNAQTASGPTPRGVPDYERFLAGIAALQRLQDRNQMAVFYRDRLEPLSDELPQADPTSAAAAIQAAKADLELRRCGTGWHVVRRRQQPVLRIGHIPDEDPDLVTFCSAFQLDRTRRKFDLVKDTVDPFLEGATVTGLDVLDLETRSLLQVLFFLAHGVDVPPCHVASGEAPMTVGPDGTVFEWHRVLAGLFRVCHASGKKPPPCARVTIRYKGYWYYIDERDRDSLSTFSLVVQLARLELGTMEGSGPVFTLPIGGR